MAKIQNKETRYFNDVELSSIKISHWGFDQRENLDKGQSFSPGIHRIFLTLGQYNKYVNAVKNKYTESLHLGLNPKI